MQTVGRKYRTYIDYMIHTRYVAAEAASVSRRSGSALSGTRCQYLSTDSMLAIATHACRGTTHEPTTPLTRCQCVSFSVF